MGSDPAAVEAAETRVPSGPAATELGTLTASSAEVEVEVEVAEREDNAELSDCTQSRASLYLVMAASKSNRSCAAETAKPRASSTASVSRPALPATHFTWSTGENGTSTLAPAGEDTTNHGRPSLPGERRLASQESRYPLVSSGEPLLPPAA